MRADVRQSMERLKPHGFELRVIVLWPDSSKLKVLKFVYKGVGNVDRDDDDE